MIDILDQELLDSASMTDWIAEVEAGKVKVEKLERRRTK